MYGTLAIIYKYVERPERKAIGKISNKESLFCFNSLHAKVGRYRP